MDLDYPGSIFDTYIMACDADCFYLIDQHAAHERVFYEKPGISMNLQKNLVRR